MSIYQQFVFVLWGEGFREGEAAIFVTVLREAGLRVKVVSVTPYQLSGAHGLTLIPDLSLDQALPLAGQALCVIVPATLPGLKRLKNDPRIAEFFRQAGLHQAWFVLGAVNLRDVAALEWIPFAEERLVFYPCFEDLVVFAQELAVRLIPVQSGSSC